MVSPLYAQNLHIMQVATRIDENDNNYALPRPPRRGSHRPEGYYFKTEESKSAAFLKGYEIREVPRDPFRYYSSSPLESPNSRIDRSHEGEWTSQHCFHRDNHRSELYHTRRLNRSSLHVSPILSNSKEPGSASESSELSDDEEVDSFATDDAKSPRDKTILHQVLHQRISEKISPALRARMKKILEAKTQAKALKPALPPNRSASIQHAPKKCSVSDCSKISVSRGLCRGHGGGRRCHFLGCTKGAQSRSNFCWAHGGGQRCEVSDCMRSRKSKRYCVAHLHLESSVNDSRNLASTIYPLQTSLVANGQLYLPSLRQALDTVASGVPPSLPLAIKKNV